MPLLSSPALWVALSGCATGEASTAPPPPPVPAPEPIEARGRTKGGGGRKAEAGSDEGPLVRKSIDGQKWPEAVCNDGTTPVFYVDRGQESDKWVVWFKGGGACSDEGQCRDRDRSLTSAEPWMRIDALGGMGNPNSDDGNASGILSRNPELNPDFHAWNHVYLVYCSSDDWAGDRGASRESFGMHFRGSQIASAMFDALGDPSIVGEPAIGSATHVLFSGSSAGAAGVRNNVDRLAAGLPRSATVKAFSDAGITPTVTPKRLDGEEHVWRERETLWKPRLDETCDRAVPAPERWKCLEGRFLALGGYIETPIFYRMDQRDSVMLGNFDRNDPAQARRAREAGAEVREIMRKLPAVYSPANGFHIVLNDPRFARERNDGLSAADVFGNWYFDRPGPKSLVVDDETDGPQGRPGRPGGRR